MKYLVLLAVLIGALSASAQLTPEMEGAKIMKRFTSFKYQRMPQGMVLPEDVRAQMIDQLRRIEHSKANPNVQDAQPEWKPFGPRSTGGRIKNLLIHPENNNWVYAASAAGGVWKSENAGGTWKPIMDDANAITLGSIWFDPSDASILYAGTGEQVTNANTYLGSGLMRTTNDGATWEVVGLTNVGSISRVYVHPKNPDLIMVAAMNTNGGVFKSLDKGLTWEKLYNGNVYDMSINPQNENEWFIAAQNIGFLSSSDGGQTWVERMVGLFGTPGRGSIQQSPTNPSVLYCLLELNGLAAIAKSINGGQSWNIQYQDGQQGSFFNGQGFYDNYIAVSPHDENVAFAGGIDIWRTTNGGTSWANMTNGYADGNGANPVHVDQHCALVHPTDPSIVYVGNDGGICRSTDGGSTFKVSNDGLSVTQFYSFDNDPTRRERAYGGTQDNGTLGTFNSNVEWDTVAGGDGMVTIVKPSDPNVVFGNFPNGRPYKIDFGNGTFRAITNGLDLNEAAQWVAPMIIHPYDSEVMFHGRTKMWRTFDGGAFWFETSPLFISTMTAIAISSVDAAIMYAGSSAGELMMSEDEGFEWTILPRIELSNNPVTDIKTSTRDRETAFVSYGTYGTPNLWKTTDLGASWTSVWTGMPNVPVNKIVIHPDDDDVIFLATDIGVFASFNGGDSWMPYGKGLPRSPVLDIKLSTEFGYLRIATHGRSAWETDLVKIAPTDPVITVPIGGDIYTGTLQTLLSWSGFTPPVTVDYSVDDGQTWNPIANTVIGHALRWTVPNWPTVTGRIRVTSEINSEEVVVSKNFTIQTLDKGGIVQQSAVNWVPYGLAWDGRDGLWSSSFYSAQIAKINANTLAVEKVIQLPPAVGDSLFTDITMDRESGRIYMHRMNSSTGVGGAVFIVDTLGKLIGSFATKATRYPTGLELINGGILAGERDGFQRLYLMDLSGELLQEVDNPYQENFGPRCLAWDNDQTVFQTSTTFPTNGGALTACYIIASNTNDLSKETKRMELIGPNGLINARGIEYDNRDKNFWLSDFGGNVFKITGFDFVSPPVTSVEEAVSFDGELTVYPNPVTSIRSISIHLSGVAATEDILFAVVDLQGRVIESNIQGMLNGNSVSVANWTPSELASGAYRVVASTKGSVIASTTLMVTH